MKLVFSCEKRMHGGCPIAFGCDLQEKRPGVNRVILRAPLTSNEKEIPLITETVGFEPTCPCGQLDFESSSL